MTTQDAAADRIRPFLRAMERSIDTARRQRLGDRAPVDQPHGNSDGGEAPRKLVSSENADSTPQINRQTLDDRQIGTSRSFTPTNGSPNGGPNGSEKVFRPRARPKTPSAPRPNQS